MPRSRSFDKSLRTMALMPNYEASIFVHSQPTENQRKLSLNEDFGDHGMLQCGGDYRRYY